MTQKAKVLIVEDEPDLAMGLKDNLEFEGYVALLARTGEEGLALAKAESPSCIILDVMLPGIDGFETCQRLRKAGQRAPIIMLTARAQEVDKVRGLELGADDYVTKPFGLQELLARIRAVLRRVSEARPGVPDKLELGRTEVNLATGRVVRGRKDHTLGHYEVEILKMLLLREGEVVERKELLERIWGVQNEPMNRSVDNHVVSIRRKVEEDPTSPKHVITVHGFGYKLVR